MILTNFSEFKIAEPFPDTVSFFLLLNCIANKPSDGLKVFLWQLRKTL